MKESKTLTPEMLGALSQAKQIYTQLSKNGVPVDAVSSETGKEHLMLFEYLTAIHNAIVKKGLPASGSKPSSSPSSSSSSSLTASEAELKEVIRKAVMDSEKEREQQLVKNGGFSYEQLYQRFLNMLESNKNAVTQLTSNYNNIFTQYSKFIEERKQAELSKYDNDQALSKSINSMTEALAPLLEANTVTFRTLLKKRIAKYKKWPRWKNPYTYMYIFIGLMLSSVMAITIHVNYRMKTRIETVQNENYEHRIVDIYFSNHPEYVKYRNYLHNYIEDNGYVFTWNVVLSLRPDFDNSIYGQNKRELK